MQKPRQLTEPFVRALRPARPGQRYAVSDALVPGLRVRVTDKGTKTFILWRRTDPRAKSASALALGVVGVLTLAQARTKARSWLAQIAEGNDPRDAERSARANTVAAAVELFLQRHVAGQRKAKDVEREIRAELVTRYGNRPLSSITRRHVIAMVDEIVDRGAPAQARNVLGHCKVFFGWCAERRALDYEGLRQKGIRYHSNHLRRLWKNNKFPKPFKPSPRRLAWWEHDIDAWLEEKASASETNNAELPAEQKAVAVAGSEVDLHAAMRALERRCRALELELQKAKKPKPAAKREAT